MLKNEKGAVLPVTMVVAAVLIVFTYYSIEKFITEKMFYKDVEDGLVLDHLLLLASSEMRNLEDYGASFDEGVLNYPNGTVNYIVISREERYLSVKLSAMTTRGLSSDVKFLYDKEGKKFLEWKEIFALIEQSKRMSL